MLLLNRIMVQIRTQAMFLILVPLLLSAVGLFYLFLTLSGQETVDVVLQKTEYLIFFTGLLYIVAITFFFFIIKNIIKKHLFSLKETLDYSKKLVSGDFTGNIKITGKDELGELTRAIKYLKDRIQYSVVKLQNSYDREKASRMEAETFNAQKTDFLKKVSKELHAPLNPVICYSNLIIAKINEGYYDKELERKVRVIRAHADNMLNIISNLNELSRLEATEFELNTSSFEISGFIEELVNLHHYSATGNGIKISYIYSPEFPSILHTDREILFHILSNILAYSIHFSPKNTEITIKIESIENEILFIISDNIAGVMTESIMSIFKHSSDRISNMTLHLSNAKLFGLVSAIANAELIEGSLTADCSNQTGSKFILTLSKKSVVGSASKQKAPLSFAASNQKPFSVTLSS